MGHVVNPVLLRLGIVNPWIAASYSRKNNKRVKNTVENFLVYKYIKKFFNNKIYLKVISKIKKRKKKYLKNFFFHNFPYIFSHLTIMHLNSTYQLNLFFYDLTLQHSLNIRNKRFYKKKIKKNKIKNSIIKRRKKIVKLRILKKYKNFFKYNNLMFKFNLKNNIIYNKYLLKRFPNNFKRQVKYTLKTKLKQKLKRKTKYYSYLKSFLYRLYKKDKRNKKNFKLRKYYKIKTSKIKKINDKNLLRLRRLKKYLNRKDQKMSLSLLKKITYNSNLNNLTRYTANAKLLFLYKLNPIVKKILNLKNNVKSYYYNTRNRFKFKNISLIKYDYKLYKKSRNYKFIKYSFSRKKNIKFKKKKSIKIKSKLKFNKNKFYLDTMNKKDAKK